MNTQYFLLIYFVVYLAVAFVWRSVAVYRATGINPVVLPSDDSAHGYIGRAFKLTLAVLLAGEAYEAYKAKVRRWL